MFNLNKLPPFITLLMEHPWNVGQLQRDYTGYIPEGNFMLNLFI
jgi:hypothetical protein